MSVSVCKSHGLIISDINSDTDIKFKEHSLIILKETRKLRSNSLRQESLKWLVLFWSYYIWWRVVNSADQFKCLPHESSSGSPQFSPYFSLHSSTARHYTVCAAPPAWTPRSHRGYIQSADAISAPASPPHSQIPCHYCCFHGYFPVFEHSTVPKI